MTPLSPSSRSPAEISLQTAFLPALLLALPPLAGAPIARETLLEALHTGATCATEVLLDPAGKSRCDYNLTEGRWYPYEEPWHTGQIILGLVEAHRLTGQPAYLAAARRAGDWWISLAIQDHPRLAGMLNAAHGDDIGEMIVFATVSDGTPGLYALSRATGDPRYAATATTAASWMLAHMVDLEQGLAYDNIDPRTGEVLRENSPFWEGTPNQTLFHVARPNNEGSLFKDAWAFSGEERFRAAFLTLSDSLLRHQDEHGLWMDFMPNHREEGSFHPRFNLWYAESLLEAYDLTRDPRYRDAAARTVDRHLQAQRSDGTLYYVNYLDGRYEKDSITGSAVAFTAVLLARLLHSGLDRPLYRERLDLCLHWLLRNRFAPDHPDPNLRGATLDLRVRHRRGKSWIVNRDIGTSFALRACAAYLDFHYPPP